MARVSRILAAVVAVVAVALPVVSSSSAVAAGARHIMPMGENGCC